VHHLSRDRTLPENCPCEAQLSSIDTWELNILLANWEGNILTVWVAWWMYVPPLPIPSHCALSGFVIKLWAILTVCTYCLCHSPSHFVIGWLIRGQHLVHWQEVCGLQITSYSGTLKYWVSKLMQYNKYRYRNVHVAAKVSTHSTEGMHRRTRLLPVAYSRKTGYIRTLANLRSWHNFYRTVHAYSAAH